MNKAYGKNKNVILEMPTCRIFIEKGRQFRENINGESGFNDTEPCLLVDIAISLRKIIKLLEGKHGSK